ncbi:hypothetical protein BZG36_00665 [Bifiguratus adelaidae]|uniref:Major facilitator superfamily (MFS) profile domain-containing protein n=1 Tax=Bifiguratus adelaidae TaxID=1938954 RepID=A0A261Y6Y1_9FUNG|nr:hypothetical protein BZG36_00665 [Bifiguratus adelaidae]
MRSTPARPTHGTVKSFNDSILGSYSESTHLFAHHDSPFVSHANSFFDETRHASFSGSSVTPESLLLEAETPLPRLAMFILSVVIFSEPLSSTILLPFIYFMVRDFHVGGDEREIGFYAGLLSSSFFLAQFCTSIFWGRMSDLYGRRPVILIGLMGNSLSVMLFGLSKTFVMAVAARMLCGILNGNVGVAKSVLGEITDHTNQARAFSVFGLCWGVGMVAGPILGGFLAEPALRFPLLFDTPFWRAYPYFLPCLVSSIGSFVGWLVAFAYFKETHPLLLKRNPSLDSIESRLQNVHIRSSPPQPIPGSDRATIAYPHNFSTSVDSCGSFSATSFTYADFYRTTNTLDSKPDQLNDYACCASPHGTLTKEPSRVTGLGVSQSMLFGVTPASIAVIAGYGMMCFHSCIFDQVFTLYSVAPVPDFGLGYSPADMAQALSLMGATQLFVQFVIYPASNKRFTTHFLYRMAVSMYPIMYILFPALRQLEQFEWLKWTSFLILLMSRFVLSVFAMTSIMIMINNSADSETLGTVNG